MIVLGPDGTPFPGVDTSIKNLGLTQRIDSVDDAGAHLVVPETNVASITVATLSQNCTIAVPDPTPGTYFRLVLIQGAGGSHTVTWPTTRWPGGVEVQPTTAVGAIDVFDFFSFDDTWNVVVAGQDFQ